ncbi:HAD-IA family hydrolase [Candidatus Daviesbacteria bacterium]|nr:HAD-IA family hydrolase [Candidatus Daviesbacteria bacterium]
MKKFKAVVFDVDGTLIDTTELIFKSFEHTLSEHNLPVRAREEIRKELGKHISEIYKVLAPSVSNPKELIDTHFNFQKKILHIANVFPNVLDTIKKLKAKGVKVAAFSNRIRTSRKSLEIAGLTPFLDFVITAEDITHPKPHPEIVEKILEYLKVKPADTILVGDSQTDILTGKNAKVKTIGVTYGTHGEKIRKSRPDFVVNNISEILPIIL